MATWIQNYVNDYEEKGKSLPLRKDHPTCKDLLGDLIPIAVREVTKQKPFQEKLEEEIQEFLADRIAWGNYRHVRVLEERKPELLKASQSEYMGFMITSRFKPHPRLRMKLCMRDFLYAIHWSYDDHRDMIDEME